MISQRRKIVNRKGEMMREFRRFRLCYAEKSGKTRKNVRPLANLPLLGEACKGASHRLHIPPKGETEKELAKPITKFSACISFQEGKIKKGGKPPFL